MRRGLCQLVFPAGVLSTTTALAADGTLVVLNKSDATASLVDLATGSSVATLRVR